MVLGILKDLHGSKAIRSRVDGNKVIKNKQIQIITKLRSENVFKLITTGDITNDLNTKSSTYGQIQNDVEYFDTFKRAGFELNTNVGNHDMMNGNEDWEPSSILSTLCSNYVNIIDDAEPLDDDGTVYHHSVHYQTKLSDIIERLEEIQSNIMLINEDVPNTAHLINLHWNVFPKSPDPKIFPESLTYEDVAGIVPSADCVIMGHIHTGHDPMLVSDVLFVSPNPHVRKNVKDRNQVPQMAFVSIDVNLSHGNRVSGYNWDLPYKPAVDIFKQDYIELGENKIEWTPSEFNLDMTPHITNSKNIDNAFIIDNLPDDEYKDDVIYSINKYLQL